MNNASLSGYRQYENEQYEIIVANHFVFGSTTLLIYASILHFPDEFEYIWKRKFSFSTLLYLLSKYPALLHQVIIVAYIFLPDTSSESVCSVRFFLSALGVLAFIGVQGSISARASALCQKYRLPVTIALSIGFLTGLVSDLFVFAAPCGGSKLGPFLLVHNISNIFLDLLAFLGVIQVWELWRSKRRFVGLNSNADLLTFLLRQGIIRFLPILLITTAEGLFATFGSNLGQASVTFENVLSTLLICEFTLDLRRRHTQSVPYQPALNLPTLSATFQDNSTHSVRSVLGRLHESIVSEMGERIDEPRSEKTYDLRDNLHSPRVNVAIGQVSLPAIEAANRQIQSHNEDQTESYRTGETP